VKAIKIEYDYLPLFLNKIVEKEFSVYSLILNQPLYRVNYKEGRIDSIYSIVPYDWFTCEKPSDIWLRDVFQTAGVLQYPNLDSVLREIREEAEKRSNITVGKPGVLVVAVDSNILYNWFISNYLVDVPNIGIAVSSIVEDEVLFNAHCESRLATRRKKLVRELRRTFQNRGIQPPEFIHDKINLIESRKAILALVELERIKKRFNVYQRIPGRGRGDKGIVESYNIFKEKHGFPLIFLTMDDRSRVYASMLNLENLFLEQYNRVTPGLLRFDYMKLPQLIYITATYFIAIRVTGERGWMDIYAEWRGKTLDDWYKGIIYVKSLLEEKVCHEIKLLKNIANFLPKEHQQ